MPAQEISTTVIGVFCWMLQKGTLVSKTNVSKYALRGKRKLGVRGDACKIPGKLRQGDQQFEADLNCIGWGERRENKTVSSDNGRRIISIGRTVQWGTPQVGMVTSDS